MYPESKVQSVEVIENGTPHYATYFVENGVIIAMVDERMMRVPVGMVDPSKTVRAMLTASIQRASRLSKTKDEWTAVVSEGTPRGRGRPKLVRGEPDAHSTH